MVTKKTESVLTRQDLLTHLSGKLNFTHRQSSSSVDSFIATFVDLLSSGNHIKMSYLGDFVLQDKKSRPGRNPKTGEDYNISARRVVKFHPAAKLKKIVKELPVD